VHPAEAIWIQQGVRKELERCISLDRDQIGFSPRGKIHFNDQTINARIALISSRSRQYATIDMKEASDRIPDVLVQILFGRKYKYFGCCRAQKYQRFDRFNKLIEEDDIHCYAPMGNATTFPVQSLVFWAICCASLQYHGYHQPSAAFVFGDDIIVPSSMAPQVIADLESFGLKVNTTKSYYRSFFRESCGTDAYKGIDVTPLRWKCDYDAEHLSGLQSSSDLAMRLRMAGYEEAAAQLYGCIRTRLRAHYGLRLPYTDNPDHGGIAEFVSSKYAWSNAYWHRDLHIYCTPVYRVKVEQLKDCSHGWNHVLESLTGLIQSGTYRVPDRRFSRRVRLVRGWTGIKGF